MAEENESGVSVNIDLDGMISELYRMQTQNEIVISELQSANETSAKIELGITVLCLFAFVIALYKVRDVLLSFVKKGGLGK